MLRIFLMQRLGLLEPLARLARWVDAPQRAGVSTR
jgi:hypothetical protein